MSKLPIEKIDKHILPLVIALNQTEAIRTSGSCEGHGLQRTASIIFNVIDTEKWNALLFKLFFLNRDLKESNINLVQRHYLSIENDHIIDWELIVEVHPRNREITEPEDKRILRVKNKTFDQIINVLKEVG